MSIENLNQSEYDVQTTTDGTTGTETEVTNTPLLDVDGSVKTNHIEDGAVTAEKLSSDVLTDSYIDITESLRSGFKNGFYNVEYTSGILNKSDNAIATDFIKCKPNDKFRVSGYSTGYIPLVFYFDSNKLPLIDENETSPQAHYDAYSETGEFFTNYEITIPENCCYVVFQSYTLGILKVESLVKQVVEKIATISYWKTYDDSDFEASARHQYTEATKLNKLSIDSWKTLKIPCKPGDKFIVSGFIPASITATAVAIFVDKDNKNPEYIDKGISGKSVTAFYKIITAPENTAFVAFNSYCSKTNGVITSGRELYVSKYVTELKTEANSNKIMNTSINPLCGKKIFVDGDSIAQGSDGISYADIIAQRNNMELTKTAVGGTTIAESILNEKTIKKDGETTTIDYKSIYKRVTEMNGEYDYILLEGGWNDMFNSGAVPLGLITDGYDDIFDTNTTIGAMEAICKYLTDNYFNTPKLFVLGHKKIGQLVLQNTYWECIKAVLEKWGIPYIDLRNETPLAAINQEINNSYFAHKFETENGISVDKGGDGTHPTRLAYEKFYVPLIEAKLKSL